MSREEEASRQGCQATVKVASQLVHDGEAAGATCGVVCGCAEGGRASGVGEQVAEGRDGAQGQQAASTRRGNAISRKVWAVLGFVAFGLGALGVALPILPTTPFMLLAAFCFARSSERLNAWFKSTKLYKRVLEGYVRKREMTVKAKLMILVPVTILLAIGFAMMGRVPVGRAVLVVVWVAHVIYFGFVVKTDHTPTEEPAVEPATGRADVSLAEPADSRPLRD